MVRLGMDPGAAVAAAALTRGVGAPGGEVGFFLLLLSCSIGDRARVRVRFSTGWSGAFAPKGLTRFLLSCLAICLGLMLFPSF
jgi:hypothetical protein